MYVGDGRIRVTISCILEKKAIVQRGTEFILGTWEMNDGGFECEHFLAGFRWNFQVFQVTAQKIFHKV